MNGAAQLYPPSPERIALTDRQQDCFDAIVRHIELFKRSPTSRELASAMNLRSFGRVHELLEALQERGWIRFLPNRARSITVIPRQPAGYSLPPNVETALLRHCCATGESAADVLADAVTLFLDEAEGSVAA